MNGWKERLYWPDLLMLVNIGLCMGNPISSPNHSSLSTPGLLGVDNNFIWISNIQRDRWAMGSLNTKQERRGQRRQHANIDFTSEQHRAFAVCLHNSHDHIQHVSISTLLHCQLTFIRWHCQLVLPFHCAPNSFCWILQRASFGCCGLTRKGPSVIVFSQTG